MRVCWQAGFQRSFLLLCCGCSIVWCLLVCTLYTSPQAVAFLRRERGGASVCLSRGGVGSSFALCLHSRRFPIRSFWTASVEPANVHPAVSLTSEPSTALFRVCCGTVILGRLVGHVNQSICSFPGSLQQRPRVPVSEGPFGAALNHNPTRTAVIFVCADSFIQVLTAKHRTLNPSPVTRSRYTPHSSGHGLSS